MKHANADLSSAIALPVQSLVEVEDDESSFEVIYRLIWSILLCLAQVEMLGVLDYVQSELRYFLEVFVFGIIVDAVEPGLNELGHFEVQLIEQLKPIFSILFPVDQKVDLLFQEQTSLIIALFGFVSKPNVLQYSE